MVLRDVYVPKEQLQGQELPAHILWDREYKYGKIDVFIPSGLKLKEVYNSNEFESTNPLAVKSVIENGFLGLLFDVDFFEKQLVTTKLKFVFYDTEGNTVEMIEKEVTLFRPKIEVVNIPETIDISEKITGKIVLKNVGYGASFVYVQFLSEGVKSHQQSSLRGLYLKLQEDLVAEFEKLKKEFPNYSSLLDDLIKDANPIDPSNKESMELRRRLAKELKELPRHDKVFFNRLFEILTFVLIKNNELLEMFESFFKSISAIAENNVLFVSAFDALITPRVKETLKVIVRYHDFEAQFYPPLEFSVAVNSSSDHETFLLDLFEWR